MTNVFSQSILTAEKKQLYITVNTDGVVYEIRISLNNLILLMASVLIPDMWGNVSPNPFNNVFSQVTVGIAEDGLLKAIMSTHDKLAVSNTTLAQIAPHEGFIHIPFPAQGIDPEKLIDKHDEPLSNYVHNILKEQYSKE